MKMKRWTLVLVMAGVLVGQAVLGLSLPEDDLVFDDIGEEAPAPGSAGAEPEPAKQAAKQPKKWHRVDRLLGIPDTIATVGHVFKLHVPKQAFSGSVDYYKLHGVNGKAVSKWLRWDEPASALYGVPSRKDVGRHRLVVKAVGRHGDTAEDSFIIHVVPDKREHLSHRDGKKRCSDDQDRMLFTMLIDAKYESLAPQAKVNALENLAGFLGLPTNTVSMQPESSGTESSSSSVESNSQESSTKSVILSGLGNVGRRREKHSTIVQWQIGCNGHFWPQLLNILKQIPEQARDGTLTEVMQLPVYRWQVRSEPAEWPRNRREINGSGDDLNGDDEDEYEEDYDDEDPDGDGDYDSEGITQAPPHETPRHKPIPIHPGPSLVDEHPHRHHHGEDSIAGIGAGGLESEEELIWGNVDMNNSIFNATSTTTPSTTIADTTPSSTTPSTTTTTEPTTTTTTTTTPEPSTTPSSTTMESTTSSSASFSPSEQESSSTAESTTSTTTTSTTTTTTTTTSQSSPSTTEYLYTESSTNATASTYTNSPQVVSISSSNATSTNVTTDSQTVDGEEPMIIDLDNETDDNELDLLTTSAPSLVESSSEPTSTSSSTTSESVVETVSSSEPNTNSIFIVNATTEEYPEGSSPAREASSTVATWDERRNATEKEVEESEESLDPYDTMHIPLHNSTTSTSMTTATPTTPSTTTWTQPSTTSSTTTTTTTTTPMTTLAPTTPTTPSTTTTTTEPTTPMTSSTSTSTTTIRPSTTSTTTTTTTTPPSTTSPSTTTTEKIEYGMRNFPPKVERRLKKVSVMQGKVLSHTVPEDTFSDFEDGSTKQLRLRAYENGAPLKPSYWMQFNEQTQEIYALPLEDQYGTYPLEIVATDSEGLHANDRIDVVVQQHKLSRVFNHEFHLYLRIEKKSAFPTNVDWQIKVMRSLAELYGDEDLSHITVRSVDIDNDQAIYSWANDSLVRSDACPQEEISALYRTLIAKDNSEDPSAALSRALGPEIKATRVVYQGLLQCQQLKEIEPQHNNYPLVRNQIDQLNATVGQLFIYNVPADTFFDEEDGDTGRLKTTLVFGDRSPIPPTNWLQYSHNEQQFYGVPLESDRLQNNGRSAYQLIAKDSNGLEAMDSLVAVVHEAPALPSVVEVSMTLQIPYETFSKSSLKKKEFIEKLKELYGDNNTSAISLKSIQGNKEMTTVTWRNISMPTDHCPHGDIKRLRGILINDESKSFTEALTQKFNAHSSDFTILQITVSQMGACQEIALGGPVVPAVDDSRTVDASNDEYLITFVLPAVIIAAMMILAGLIACILYKKKRSGKMSISEKDDERQSFRSKGIPVIFQDELEEKPDPGNKSPIILKEEKPPLPPPEYQRAEDGADIPMLSKENSEEPYQPPPPFATNRDSNRQNRPKPTPTYRKPPPYVPP